MVKTMKQNECHSMHSNSNETPLISKQNVKTRVQTVLAIIKSRVIHSEENVARAGLKIVGNNGTVRCNACQLEVSRYSQDMIPLMIHSEHSPNCSHIQSQTARSRAQSNDEEYNAKRQKTESNSNQFKHTHKLIEVNSLKNIRRRTFSHWTNQMKPSAEKMIFAGFFSCNVGDRVICLYCNLICHQWKADIDDPTEVHRTLSPHCAYVLSMFTNPEPPSTVVCNEPTIIKSPNHQTAARNNTAPVETHQIVSMSPCHPVYSDITKRFQTFTAWPKESSISIEAVVQAGFFYAGVRNIITCFCCGESLQNLSANSDPVIEHIRWFSDCYHARRLCGEEIYQKVQEAKRIQLVDSTRIGQSNEIRESGNLPVPNHGRLQINDSNMLSRIVAARLDLESSQNLLNQNFSLSVIKRCWENQIQLKNDFFSDSDLYVACVILQKQINHIKGQKENIIVPSVQMKLVQERKQLGLPSSPVLQNDVNRYTLQNQLVPETTVNQSIKSTNTQESLAVSNKDSTKSSFISNPCTICYEDEKRLACIPCGHFTTCISCSRSLRTCPVCRRSIEAFVRVYI